MIGAAPQGSVGLLWLNPTDTFIDIYAPEQSVQATQWMFEAGVIDLFFLPGPSQTAILDQYTQLTSRPSMPPFFSLGYHQSRWNYLDEKDVEDVTNKFEELNFPFDVIWLDIEHTISKKYFTWDPNNFKNSKQMVEKLVARGPKLVTIVDPHVKKETGYRIYDEGWCWPGTSSYPDFTNPVVRSWWADQFAYDKYEGSTADVYTWNDMNEVGIILNI